MLNILLSYNVIKKLPKKNYFVFIFLIDLKTMADRLKMRYYVHRKLFIADMSRIFSNCRHYNEPDTEYVKCTNTLEKYYIAKMKDAGAWEK